MGALYGACTGAATGAASGAVISGGIEYLKTRDLEATKQAAIDGAADGFMWGAIGGAVTGGMNSPHCFVAGTLICTVDGEVPIEDIQVGDYVLAENPDTGEIDYKPVLETYEHDTYDVVYLTIDGEDFTTTEGHPFYTLERGFVKAGELRFSDTLVDDEGNKLHLDKKSNEHLDEPVTVYNFAVEDYHTYFVGENDVLVHNSCGLGKDGEAALSKLVGGESQQYFKTKQGGRFVDQLADRVAHESKVGYTSLSTRVRKQILKDAELVSRGQVDDAVWHFFRSNATGKIGPSEPLKQFLRKNGIDYVVYKGVIL